VVILPDDANQTVAPFRWLTYNPNKAHKDEEQGKNTTEKGEERKEGSVDKTDSNTGKANFVHYKTTIGIGRS
jgi:hypothetical protein